jgi:hypothetical protein
MIMHFVKISALKPHTSLADVNEFLYVLSMFACVLGAVQCKK